MWNPRPASSDLSQPTCTKKQSATNAQFACLPKSNAHPSIVCSHDSAQFVVVLGAGTGLVLPRKHAAPLHPPASPSA
jgi:hypothetical protein